MRPTRILAPFLFAPLLLACSAEPPPAAADPEEPEATPEPTGPIHIEYYSISPN